MSARASRLAACRVYRRQPMAVPFAVRYPANVRSCKHGGRLPGVSHKKQTATSGCLFYSNGSLRRRTSNMPSILFFFRNQMIRQSHKYNGAYHVSYSCQKYIVYILANPYVSVY